MKTEILLHIPHSSYFIPNEYKNLFCINEEELRIEQIKMTDSYTDELFNLPYKKIIPFVLQKIKFPKNIIFIYSYEILSLFERKKI